MSLVVVIPARGGSRRIPKKNIRPFFGRPMIHYALDLGLEFADRVLISTDSEEIFGVCSGYGPKVEWIRRPDELAVDHVGTQDVTAHALREGGVRDLDLVCVIYPTVPLLAPEDVDRGYLAMGSRSVRYAFGVSESPFGPAGAFYWGWATAFMDNEPLVHEHSRMIPIPPERCCDINTRDDWHEAEIKYRKLHPEIV